AADGGAVHRRQHEVEEEDVGAVGGHEFGSLAAVGESRDCVIEAFEPDLGRFPDDLVILDQNNMHYVSPFSRVKRCPGSNLPSCRRKTCTYHPEGQQASSPSANIASCTTSVPFLPGLSLS